MATDIEELVNEGWVRVIWTQYVNKRTDEKKKRIFFPINKVDEDVEIKIPENCHKYISKLWDEKVGDNANVKWE